MESSLCNEAHWLFASPTDDGTDFVLSVSYGTALHVPGCVAAVASIQVAVRLRLIAEPPPRFARQNKPYALKDINRQHGVERWLIPVLWTTTTVTAMLTTTTTAAATATATEMATVTSATMRINRLIDGWFQ